MRKFAADSRQTQQRSVADQLEHKLTELTFQATHDPLSGLPNRKLFLQSVTQADCGVDFDFLRAAAMTQRVPSAK